MTDAFVNKSKNKYKRLIMEGADFQVVIDAQDDIDWNTTRNYDWGSISSEDIRKFNLIINKAAELESYCSNLNLLSSRQSSKRLIAEAIARALDRDNSAAFNMLSVAEKIVFDDLQDQQRNIFLLSSLVFTVPFLII